MTALHKWTVNIYEEYGSVKMEPKQELYWPYELHSTVTTWKETDYITRKWLLS